MKVSQSEVCITPTTQIVARGSPQYAADIITVMIICDCKTRDSFLELEC